MLGTRDGKQSRGSINLRAHSTRGILQSNIYISINWSGNFGISKVQCPVTMTMAASRKILLKSGNQVAVTEAAKSEEAMWVIVP